MKKIIAFCFVMTLWSFTGFTDAASSVSTSVNDIQILRISEQDQRAVVKDKKGKMKVIKPGDLLRVSDGELLVVEIVAGRVVLEQKNGNEAEKVIIRLVNGEQKIERLRNVARPGAAKLIPVHQDQKVQ